MYNGTMYIQFIHKRNVTLPLKRKRFFANKLLIFCKFIQNKNDDNFGSLFMPCRRPFSGSIMKAEYAVYKITSAYM